MSTLDLDRGVTIRMHPSGFRVGMYKDDPGRYYDSSGEPLSDEIASAAGFDVERDTRKSLKERAIAEMRARIEREFAEKEQEAESIINASVAGSRFKVEHVGGGKYSIVDENGKRFTQRAMTQDEAGRLLADLSGGKSAGLDLKKMSKRDLEAHAKDRFGVDLDLRTFNTEAKIIAEINRLAAEAGSNPEGNGGDNDEAA